MIPHHSPLISTFLAQNVLFAYKIHVIRRKLLRKELKLGRMRQMLIANGFLHFAFMKIVKISISFSEKLPSRSLSTGQNV